MSNQVFNFRVLRGADRKVPDEGLWLDLLDQDIATAFKALPAEVLAKLMENERIRSLSTAVSGMFVAFAQNASSEQRAAIAGNWLGSADNAMALSPTLDPVILSLDLWLAEKKNRPSGVLFESKLAELAKSVDPQATDGKAIVARVEFLQTHFRLIGTILAGLLVANDPDLWPYEHRQRVARLFVVTALVLRWCADKQSVDERREIAYFLKYARIRIPANVLRSLRTPDRLVRRPGFIDHYVVRETWKRYELGELADVNSVMPGEVRKRSHTRLSETEDTSSSETERIDQEARNLQSENRFELSVAAHEAQSMYVTAEADVTVTVESEPTTTVAYAGGSFDYSSDTSKDTASKHTRNIIDQASSVVHQRVLQARSSRQLTRITEINEHSFDNSGSGASPVNGIYRWIDKVNEVSLYRYPRRYVVEFMLPEPGAWLKWAVDNRQRSTDLPVPPPAWPTWLNSSDDINSLSGAISDYRILAKYFGATDVPVYPEQRVIGVTLSRDPEENEVVIKPVDPSASEPASIRYSTQARIAIPEGYKAVRFTVTATSMNRFEGLDAKIGRLWVTVGETRVDYSVRNDGVSYGGSQSGVISGVTTGQLPIHVADLNDFGFAANIVVECEPTAETIVKWQQTVFDRFLQTHQRARTNYENALDALKVAGEFEGRPLSPGKVRSLIIAELKRQIIALIDPNTPMGTSSLLIGSGGEPSVNPSGLNARAVRTLFFEQAFEWSTLSYVLYPHYWARKQVWPEAATTESENPEFDQFVQSGSARIVVAARPGFAEQVQFFLDYGIIWGGAGVPAPDEPGYISVAEEIMDLQRGPADGELVDSWEVRLPTALTALDPSGSFPLIHP